MTATIDQPVEETPSGGKVPLVELKSVGKMYGNITALKDISLRVHAGEVTGMGVPEGVTLIAGGGFHGKSTLLEAISLGIYPHIPGDGRERVATRHDTVKVCAEDGRRVEKVNISAFIDNLPGGIETRGFSTDNASGSTSQASYIIEAVEMGAHAFLIDEDISATNFLIRDARMQRLSRVWPGV